MKLGIYTNLDQQCGNAEDARYLLAYLRQFYPDIEYSNSLQALTDRDIVIVNWHPSVVRFYLEDAQLLKQQGIKILLIHQNSYSTDLQLDGTLSLCDAIVAHEPMGDKVIFIPVGIPYILNLPETNGLSVGTAGFPFPWKRFDVVAEIAKHYNIKCKMIAPRSTFLDTDKFIQGLVGHIPSLIEVTREWLPIDTVVKYLARNTINIFWYQSQDASDEFGQTGSARMGIASRRPTIISRHRKFRTLFDYEDELYIAEREDDVYKYVEQILSNPEKAKRPNRVIEEMGWPTIVNKYKEVIERL